MKKELIFAADPMCSWCWGFSPVLARVRAAATDRASVRIILGGLRPGTDNLMGDEMKAYVRHHWQDVQARTNQPFDFALFERDDFIYNTEPACRAVVVARTLSPGMEIDLYDALQKAFYAEGRDVTAPGVLRDIAVEQGLDAQAFTDAFNDPAAIEATFNDFAEARRLGVQGFPTLIVHEIKDDEEDGYAFLTRGYQPYDELEVFLEAWLATG